MISKSTARAAIGIALLIAFAATAPVHAAEIKVLSANVFTGVLDELFAEFERTSGHKVTFIYGTAGAIRNRVQTGEFADITILPRPMLDELQRQGKVAPGVRNLARSAVAVVVRSGAQKPDIASLDAFMRSLQTAASVSYPDPARGGATGVLFTKIIERLDLVEALKSKTKYPPPGHFAVELVAKGEVEMAIAQPMEALLQPGVEIVGLLPLELQDPPNFTFSVSLVVGAKEPEAAQSLIAFLTGATVAPVLKMKGMYPD